jgi:hypothetical protein
MRSILEYLEPLNLKVMIPETRGEWTPERHEKIFRDVWEIDQFFPKQRADVTITPGVVAVSYSPNFDGMALSKIIPNEEKYFFKTANQALEIFQDAEFRAVFLAAYGSTYLPCLIGKKKQKFLISFIRLGGLVIGGDLYPWKDEEFLRGDEVFFFPKW